MQGVHAEPGETAHFPLVLNVKPLELEFVFGFFFAIREYQRAQGQTKRNRSEPIICQQD